MLLGIEGLTRSRLDTLTEAFFEAVGRYYPIYYSKQEFKLRCGVRLDLNAGLPPTVDKPALSELLILAVACRGAGSLEQMDMVEAMEHRFCVMAAEGDTLLRAGLDGVEAVNMLSEREVRPIHPFVSVPGRTQKVQKCLQIDPLGRGYGIDLAFQNDVHLGERGDGEDDRRRTIFWTIYMVDAIRSLSARRMYRIHDEDVGWPPRGSNPLATETTYGSTMYAIALLSRRLCRSLFSARAKVRGITAEEVIELLAKLDAWPVDHDVNAFFRHPQARSSAPHAAAKMMWLSMYLGLVCSVSTEVKLVPDDLTSVAYDRLHDATIRACQEASKLAQQCTEHSLVDAAPNVLRNISAAWGLWCARMIAAGRSDADTSPIGREHFQELWNAAYTFIDCVRSAKRTSQSARLADSLENTLLKAVHLNDEALHEQMSGNASGTAPPLHMDTGGRTSSNGESDRRTDDIMEIADTGLSGGDRLRRDPQMQTVDRLAGGSGSDVHKDSFSTLSEIDTLSYTINAGQQQAGADLGGSLDDAWQAWQALDNDVYQFLADVGIEMPLQTTML
jgi:hypothetical protein